MKLPCPVIDAHAHLWPTDPQSNADSLVRMADRFGLEEVWVSALFGGLYPDPADVDAGNEAACRLARRDPRMRVWVRVQPEHREHTLDVLDRLVRTGPAIGVKVWIHPADSSDMDPLMERLVDWGRPLLIHAYDKATGNYDRESYPEQVAGLARRHPGAKILMAHLGGRFYRGCDAIADCPNVWSDFCGTLCETGMVSYAVRTLGPRRVVFGTDAPGASFINNLAKLLAEPLDEQTCRRILCQNARDLVA